MCDNSAVVVTVAVVVVVPTSIGTIGRGVGVSDDFSSLTWYIIIIIIIIIMNYLKQDECL